MTSASTPSRSIPLMRRCGSPGRRMPFLPSPYTPVAAILSTRSFLPRTWGVGDVRHAVLQLPGCLGHEQVRGEPDQIEVTVRRDSVVAHGSPPFRLHCPV